MRVLHVIHSVSAKSGGPIAGLTRIAESCDYLGYHVEVACLNDPADVGREKLPFPVYAFGSGKTGYSYSPTLLPWLREHAHHYDGVVINGVWQYHGFAAWRAFKGRLPYFVFTHGMLDPWFKRQYPLKHLKKLPYWTFVESRILNDADGVLFTTPSEMNLARQNFPFHRWKGVVVPYGALGPDCSETAAKSAFYERWPTLRGRRLLLYLGRIHEKKGCDLLIQAFANFAHEHSNVDLVMEGPDSDGLTSKLQNTAAALGVSGRIHWTGLVEGRLKWGAYAACEAFILPSHQENFGISVAEALASGRPVLIANKVNIFDEIRKDGSAFVEDDDLSGTTKLVNRYLNLAEVERKTMGERALDTFNARYNIQNCGRKLLSLFDGAIRTPGEAASRAYNSPAIQR